MTVATLEGLIRVGGFPNDKPAPPTVFILYPTVNEEEENFDMNLLGYVSFSFLTKEEMAAVKERLKERKIETIEDELTKQPPPTREQMGKDLDELRDKLDKTEERTKKMDNKITYDKTTEKVIIQPENGEKIEITREYMLDVLEQDAVEKSHAMIGKEDRGEKVKRKIMGSCIELLSNYEKEKDSTLEGMKFRLFSLIRVIDAATGGFQQAEEEYNKEQENKND